MVLRCAAAVTLAALVPLLLYLHLENVPYSSVVSFHSMEPPERQLRVVVSLDQGEVVVIKDALISNQTYLWVTYSNMGDTPVNLTLLSYPPAAASACFAAEGYSLATLKKTTMADVANSCDLEPTEQGDMPNNATMHSDVAVVLGLVNRNALPVDITDLQLFGLPPSPAPPVQQPAPEAHKRRDAMPMSSVYAASIVGLLAVVSGVALMHRWQSRSKQATPTDHNDALSV